jgi:hypothetical protein
VIRRIAPDPARRVDLPGVGPVPRPLEVGRDVSGLLGVTLRGYRFAAGHVIDGEAEGDEVAILLASGRVSLEVAAGHAVPAADAERHDLDGRAEPFAGDLEGVYLPPHHAYRLRVVEEAEVLYARAVAEGRHPPARLTAGDACVEGSAVRVPSRGARAEWLRIQEVRVRSAGEWAFMPRGDAIVVCRLAAGGSAATARAGALRLDLHDGDALAVPAGVSVTMSAPAAAALAMTIVCGRGPDDVPPPGEPG